MISIFPNIFHEDMNLGANFISKMSKLFGEVGRVDRKMFVQTFLSHNYISRYDSLVFCPPPLFSEVLKV